MAANRRPGGVRLGDFNPRAVEQDGPLALGAAPGAGAGARRFAETLSRAADRLGQAADRAAQREGRDAGAIAGLDPEFRPREGDGEFDRAFNAAGSAVYLQNLEVDVSARIAEIGETMRGDPEGMNAAFDGLADELRRSQALQDPVMRAAFEPMFARQRLGWQRQAFRDEVAAQRDAQAAAADRWAATRHDAIVRLARSAGLDEMADDALTGEIETLQNQLVAFGPRESFEFRGQTYEADPDRAGAYSLQQIETILSRSEAGAEEARVAGAYDRLPNDLEARQEFQEAFRSDWSDGAYDFVDDAARARLDSAMTVDINRRQTAANAARSDALRALDRALDRATDVTDAGLSPGEGVFERITAEAERLGDAELAREARETAAIAEAADWAWTQPPAVLQSEINEARARLEAGGATPFEANRLEVVERVQSRMMSALNSDPLSVAVRAGLVEVPPLQMADETGAPSMQAFADSLSARAATAEAVADHYGIAPRYFTEAERRSFSDAVDGDQVTRLALADRIVSALGDDAPRALAELAPNEPLLAHIGGMISAGAVDAARDADAGKRLRNEEGFASVLPPIADRSAEAERAFGDVARTLPRTVANARGVADDIYTYRAARQGLTADDFDDRLYQRALNEAMGATYLTAPNGRRLQFGGLSDVNGHETIAPGWMRADRLDEAMQALARGEIEGVATAMFDASGREIEPRYLRRGWLLAVGDGQYHVAWGSSERPEIAMTEDGAPFVLDMNGMRDAFAGHDDRWVRP